MAGDEDLFERFKFEILDDAVFEDVQGLWEPLWALRGYLRQPHQREDERQALAELALRELYAEGLIYFFRVPPHSDLDRAADDPALRLGSEEVNTTLSDTWWRGATGLPTDHPNIWWWATEKGRSAANDRRQRPGEP